MSARFLRCWGPFFVIVLACSGCSSDGDNSNPRASTAGTAGGGAGTSGGGGTAGGSTRYQGAVAIDFQATGDCSGQTMMIRARDNGGVPPVTASSISALMTDDGFNVNHTSGVHCVAYQLSDGTYMFDGKIFFDMPQPLSLAMYTQFFDPNAGPALGGFQISHSDLPVEYGTQAGQAAEFEFIEIEPGRAWGKFKIDELPNFDDDTLCAVGESYFAFENCDLSY
ncbi:MAG TPA: hypothetical protein VM686_24390 [Polyangiaceae bacterium]|nr:hypothetical protein [Polyangiaceae bacterium]